MLGIRSDVMEARWYELGTFSPINRLHSTKMSFSGKEPWNFRPEVEHAMGEALQLKAPVTALSLHYELSGIQRIPAGHCANVLRLSGKGTGISGSGSFFC